MTPRQRALLLFRLLLLLYLRRIRQSRRRAEPRTIWIQDAYTSRGTHGEFVRIFCPMKQLAEQGNHQALSRFYSYTRLELEAFKKLLRLLAPSYFLRFYLNELAHYFRLIKKSNRVAISAEERLVVTIRFLATGTPFRGIEHQFLIAHQTISKIVRETCEAIWDLRGTYLRMPNTPEEWQTIAHGFATRWNMPNCIGNFCFFKNIFLSFFRCY